MGLPAFFEAAVWLGTSLFLISLQYGLVFYNAWIISIELTVMYVLRMLRHTLRFISWPLPSRWQSKKKLWLAIKRLRDAQDYESWHTAAKELDELEGAREWRMTKESELYDYSLVEETTRRLRQARRKKDIHSLLFNLSAVMDRSYGGINNMGLFSHSLIGTKAIIEAFLVEVCACLDTVAEAPEMTEDAKLEFFEGCRLALGRTALALSGGGALAMCHAGVVRTLLLNGLLPRVLSGTSGGSIIAGMMALHTDEELLGRVLHPRIISEKGVTFFDPLHVQLRLFIQSTLRLGAPQMVDNERFAAALRAYFGEATFLEAYARTGRIVNISVSVSSGGGVPRPLVLNYLTTPHVLLWSAVAASCALPGLMRPVTIMAKDHRGVAVPYMLPGLSALDGSMSADLPLEHLKLTFHAQRLIVSQANPHVVPFVSKEHGPRAGVDIDRSQVSKALKWCEAYLALEVRARTRFLAKARLIPRWWGNELSGLFLQRYTSDHVTILPATPLMSIWRAITQPSEEDMRFYLATGAKATFPHLAAIRSLVAVEKTLSRCARRFMRRQQPQQSVRAPLYRQPAALTAGPVPAALPAAPATASAAAHSSFGRTPSGSSHGSSSSSGGGRSSGSGGGGDAVSRPSSQQEERRQGGSASPEQLVQVAAAQQYGHHGIMTPTAAVTSGRSGGVDSTGGSEAGAEGSHHPYQLTATPLRGRSPIEQPQQLFVTPLTGSGPASSVLTPKARPETADDEQSQQPFLTPLHLYHHSTPPRSGGGGSSGNWLQESDASLFGSGGVGYTHGRQRSLSQLSQHTVTPPPSDQKQIARSRGHVTSSSSSSSAPSMGGTPPNAMDATSNRNDVTRTSPESHQQQPHIGPLRPVRSAAFYRADEANTRSFATVDSAGQTSVSPRGLEVVASVVFPPSPPPLLGGKPRAASSSSSHGALPSLPASRHSSTAEEVIASDSEGEEAESSSTSRINDRDASAEDAAAPVYLPLQLGPPTTTAASTSVVASTGPCTPTDDRDDIGLPWPEASGGVVVGGGGGAALGFEATSPHSNHVQATSGITTATLHLPLTVPTTFPSSLVSVVPPAMTTQSQALPMAVQEERQIARTNSSITTGDDTNIPADGSGNSRDSDGPPSLSDGTEGALASYLIDNRSDEDGSQRPAKLATRASDVTAADIWRGNRYASRASSVDDGHPHQQLVSALKGSKSSPSFLLAGGAGHLAPSVPAASGGGSAGKTVTFQEAVEASDDGGPHKQQRHQQPIETGASGLGALLTSPVHAAQQWMHRVQRRMERSLSDGSGSDDDKGSSEAEASAGAHAAAWLPPSSSSSTTRLGPSPEDLARAAQAVAHALAAAGTSLSSAAVSAASGPKGEAASQQPALAISAPPAPAASGHGAHGRSQSDVIIHSPDEGRPTYSGVLTPMPPGGLTPSGSPATSSTSSSEGTDKDVQASATSANPLASRRTVIARAPWLAAHAQGPMTPPPSSPM